MHKLSQLQLEQITLAPAEEWMDAAATWRFVRVTSGAVYWLGAGVTRSLGEGEVIVAAPTVVGTFRASQIGEVRLHGFSFTLELLCGFFTLSEREVLEAQAKGKSEIKFLPSTHPVATQFTAHVLGGSVQNALARRVAGLELVAGYFDEQLKHQRPLAAVQTNANDRFAKVIAAMPETELINHSPESLAKLCGCSARHFNRLFQQHFGKSARVKQTELRLQKSRQLLVASDDKVVNVALECGYENLSLFNSLFKRRFNMTPSEWRKKNVKPVAKTSGPLRRRLAAMALGVVACVANVRVVETNVVGVVAPVATAKTNAPLTFRVETYEVAGCKFLPLELLTPIFEKYRGEAVTFEMIRKARGELLMAYRERGFVTVAVEVPPQKLTNGIVQLKVTEGVLTDVVVKNNKHYSVENILRALPTARTNTLLNGLVFQQQLDRANANSDRQIYPVIGPGPEPGTSSLELRVKDRLPFHLHLELNNAATPKTPDMRMNVSATYNNLWQRDHQVGVQYSLTPEDLKSDDEQAPHVQPWERPLIASYSAYYRMPLAPVNGYPRAYDLREFGYDEVTHRFRPPPLTGAPELLLFASRSHSDTGQQLQSRTIDPEVIPPTGAFPLIIDELYARSWSINEDMGVRYSKPLASVGPISSTVSFGFDLKNFRLRTRQLRSFQAVLIIPTSGSFGPPFTVIPSPAINSTNVTIQTVAYLPLALDWSGAVTDKHGATVFDLSQSVNFIGNKKDFQDVAGASGADGLYYVINGSLTRDQKVWNDWGVRLHADGQWANEPLISNEQFGVGGQAGVRGFLEGRVYGDAGWRAQLEPHTPYLDCGAFDGDVPLLVRGYAYLDYGQVYSFAASAHTSLMGAGCGFDASIGEHFDFRVNIGVPLRRPDTTSPDNVHVAFSLGMQL